MKKLLKKKNNKGFSLVELIVVVLIMAIIAVALSPQVLKWVEKSRQATDAQNYDALIADLQIAMTNKKAYAEGNIAEADKITVTISANADVAFDGGSNGADDDSNASTDENYDAIMAALTNVQSDWKSVRVKSASASEYKIYIHSGNVWRSTVATEVPETNIENELESPTT